ncbi:MAG: FdtA/QdtA family cupin domain-containing protein [Lachnospiraceae bacterium]|nr:FdtA/QdtA family cupin domain-containing protein [Lachnospiraceae bacterium]
MKYELKYGLFRYVVFLISNIICILSAYAMSSWTYLVYFDRNPDAFGTSEGRLIAIVMVTIDFFVAIVFRTLKRVLRRRKRYELLESIKHVGISFSILAIVLFLLGEGTWYSRVTVCIAYGIDFFLIAGSHTVLKIIFRKFHHKSENPTAIMVSTDMLAYEGIKELRKIGIEVKYVLILKNVNRKTIADVPIINSLDELLAIMCWKWVDQVRFCGQDDVNLIEAINRACRYMRIPVYMASTDKSFEYEIVKIRTALQKDDQNTGLSFFEGEHDIPFRISRLYTIYEKEQEHQKGFHAHKKSWHLLFCPYGVIDVIVDTGQDRKTISLTDPSIGLILHPSVWREIYWRKPGSVLCVAASGHYDADKLKDDYAEYQKFLQDKEWSAFVESVEITGEDML